MVEREKLEILGIPVDVVDMRKAIAIFGELMGQDGCSLIVTPNSEIVVNAGKDPKLAEVIRSADMVIPDGIGLVYASKILGRPLQERVTGIDFTEMALLWLREHDCAAYLFGSKPQTEEGPGVAELAGLKMQQKYPGLTIAGTHHGYFKPEDEEQIVAEINASGADFLCVALGSPKQEEFVARHRHELKVRAAVGVGGSLDVWAGTLKRAPEFYQKHGLEWLYRLAQEPTRVKRMAALPTFMVKVAASKLKK